MNEQVSKWKAVDMLFIYFMTMVIYIIGAQGIIKVELVNGTNANAGRVEIVRDGIRGTICNNTWDDLDAAVICRMLGYNYGGMALSNQDYGEGSGTIWLDNVTCIGDEATIEACGKNDWGQNNCDHDKDAEVTCHLVSHSTNDITVELVGGTDTNEGRVEIIRNNVRGTVCDDSWDDKDAAVICRMVGYYNGGKAEEQAAFGEGTGQIWVDDAGCDGNEDTIEVCSRTAWGENNCQHTEDAGVKCNLKTSYVAENLAFQKPTIMSSTFQYEDSEYAVDGNMNTFLREDHCSHTDMYDDSPWWMVDLRGTYLVDSVLLTNRGDAFWERLHSFVIEIFTQNPLHCAVGTSETCSNYTGAALGRGETRNFTCEMTVRGRYVRVMKWKVDAYYDVLTLCEVQIFGTAGCKFPISFHSKQNSRWISQDVQMTSVTNHLECALKCEQKTTCLAFNFNINTHECELIFTQMFNDTNEIQAAWNYYGSDQC